MSTNKRAGAWHLLGKTLDSGWNVVAPVGWDPVSGESTDQYNGTGGNFSVAYIVEKEGRRAFLKAIDFSEALDAVNVFETLRKITDAHAYEVEILRACQMEGMTRIVVAIDSGEIRVGENLQDTAPYLVFELADGDVRRRIQKVDTSHRLAWWLRAMHHATIGLSQLHSRRITHQDLKPSNLLSFGDSNGFKIADLGRSTREGTSAPHEDVLFPGDWRYAPPELIYGLVDPLVLRRRLCGDLYLLGSMIFFFARGFGCTALLMESLESPQKPYFLEGGWAGSYETILPILQHAFTDMLCELRGSLNVEFADRLVVAASELCNPDPSKRGHPLERRGTNHQFSLQRYISLFDLLAKKAAIHARLQP